MKIIQSFPFLFFSLKKKKGKEKFIDPNPSTVGDGENNGYFRKIFIRKNMKISKRFHLLMDRKRLDALPFTVLAIIFVRNEVIFSINFS